MDKHDLIVKGNALIEASHRLGETEQRLVLLAILKAREMGNSIEQLKGKQLTISADDYVKHFHVDKQSAYVTLKNAALKLFEAKWGYKCIDANGNVAVHYERFTQNAVYVNKQGIVRIKFADAIIPFLMELERHFTSYEIKYVTQLSSGYSIRLYEFFMQYLDKSKGKGWLEISYESLRFRFGLLNHEYEKMSNFKNRILDFSIKEINEKTNLIVTYEQKKEKWTIVGFKFSFHIKPNTAQPSEEIITPYIPITHTHDNTPQDTSLFDDASLFNGLTDKERQSVKARVDEYISHLESKGETVSDYHRQNIIKKAVAERWGLDSLEKQERKQEERRKKAEAEARQAEAEQQEREAKKANDDLILEQVCDYWRSLDDETRTSLGNILIKSAPTPQRKKDIQSALASGDVEQEINVLSKAQLRKGFVDLVLPYLSTQDQVIEMPNATPILASDIDVVEKIALPDAQDDAPNTPSVSEMMIDPTPATTAKSATDDSLFSNDELMMIERFKSLSELDRNILIGVMSSILEANGKGTVMIEQLKIFAQNENFEPYSSVLLRQSFFEAMKLFI